MRYIAQIFTGNYDAPQYTAQQIIRRLCEIEKMIRLDALIIGWYPDPALYKEVGACLREKGVDMFLWLPVFSETGEFVPMTRAVDLFGRPIETIAVQEGEAFSFCCPSSRENAAAVKRVYERHFADCGFTGVFLDRIRTHSFVGGVGGVLSCGCDSCREAYRRYGVSLEQVAQCYTDSGEHFFDRRDGVFVQEQARLFFDTKAAVVTDSIASLCEFFRAQGMQVGLDLYAPQMSGFVGQDPVRLAPLVDFIKPMLYRRTEAPAGIAYEYRLLQDQLPSAQGYPPLVTDKAFLASQAASLAALPCAVYPGIEINYREDIARTDSAYIRESVTVLRESGASGVTLSWDIMLAPDDHIAAVADVL